MSKPSLTPQSPGASVYRLIVKSAEEAVQTIRDRFGPEAKVLSVRQLEGQGLGALFSRPKLEVLVQVGTTQGAEPEPAPLHEAIDTAARSLKSVPQPQAQPAASVSPMPSVQVSAEPATPSYSGTEDLASVQTPESASAASARGTRSARPSNRAMSPVDLPSHDLPDLLRRVGFSETLMARLSALPSWSRHYDQPLHITLSDLGQELRSQLSKRKLRPLPSRSAFIGMRGVGRTTALCKWLGAEVFLRGRRGRVMKVEFDQPNPCENLSVFCEALGMGMEHYAAGVGVDTEPGEFLYADLPGMELRNRTGNDALLRFLNTCRIEGRVLVLNALHDSFTLRAAYSTGRELGATHLVFTHCDELQQWGKLMDFLIDGELTPLFLATGPSLSGDCDEDAVGTVLKRTIPGL